MQQLSDYDYELPEERIALRPLSPRPASRMLVSEAGGALRDRQFFDLPDALRPGDRLVFNDTKVLPARLIGERLRDDAQLGRLKAGIEVTLLAPEAAPGQWRVLAKPARKLAPGDRISFARGLEAEVLGREESFVRLRFALEGTDFEAALEAHGQMPLPPYIERLRKADAADKADYQPVFAKNTGAVAAPTASLHFDGALLAALAARGVDFSFVTLHVGAGTFLPVKVEKISAHKMHGEWGEISEETAAQIRATQSAGGRVICVGTTALRLIETAARGGALKAWSGETDIFITPGFSFQCADALITNFHLPKSTLLMLVAAFVGYAQMKAIYAHALAQNYRFFSYGDGSLLWRGRARDEGGPGI